MLSLGMKNRQALWKIVWKFLKQLPHNPAVRIKCNSVRGKKALCQKKKIHAKTWKSMFLSALFNSQKVES